MKPAACPNPMRQCRSRRSAPGLLVVTGSAKDSADPRVRESWVASVSYDGKEGSPLHVAMIASEAKLPVGWPPPAGEKKWRFDPLRVIAIGNVSDPDEDPRAWVLVKGPHDGKFTSVEINARTLEAVVRIPKIATAAAGPEGLAPVQGIERETDPAPAPAPPIIGGTFPPGASQPSQTRRRGAGRGMGSLHGRARRGLSIRKRPFVQHHLPSHLRDPNRANGHFRLPLQTIGRHPQRARAACSCRWITCSIFPANAGIGSIRKPKKSKTSAPACNSPGASVEYGVSYAVSAHFGVCAFSATEGCFHPFSVDPAKLLAAHATNDGLNPAVAGRPPVARPRSAPPIIARTKYAARSGLLGLVGSARGPELHDS